jgi:hypothetical protein
MSTSIICLPLFLSACLFTPFFIFYLINCTLLLERISTSVCRCVWLFLYSLCPLGNQRYHITIFPAPCRGSGKVRWGLLLTWTCPQAPRLTEAQLPPRGDIVTASPHQVSGPSPVLTKQTLEPFNCPKSRCSYFETTVYFLCRPWIIFSNFVTMFLLFCFLYLFHSIVQFYYLSINSLPWN